MPLPTGQIDFNQIRTELSNGTGGSFPASGAMPFNDATFRSRLTDTAQNAQLSISDIRGNAYQRFTIAADTQAYDIRSALVAAGWNGTAKGSVDLVINGGVIVSAPSFPLTVAGLDTGGPWPAPSTINLYSNGYILGMGGAGGAGGIGQSPALGGSTAGSAGSTGGLALRVQRTTTLVNTGVIGGGGGGGGGGAGFYAAANPLGGPASTYGGGGGGGGQSGRTNSGGGPGGAGNGTPQPFPGAPGGAGTFSGAGGGGAGAPGGGAPAANKQNPGGSGGTWGAAGAAGDSSPLAGAGPAGGAGPAISGWSVTVGSPSGTIYGPVIG